MKALLNNRSSGVAGFSLVELLVAISLLAIVFTLSFPTLRLAIRTMKSLEQTSNAAGSSDYLLTQIQRIAQQSNPALGTELLGIAPKTILPTRLNATSEVLLLKDTALDTALAKNKSTSQPRFCALFAQQESKRDRIEKSKLYLLHDSDGVTISSGNIKRTNEKSCREYLFDAEAFALSKDLAQAIDFDPTSAKHSDALLVIPILDLFAFYLDDQQTLRRYSFISNQSQPLLRDVESFTLSQSVEEKGRLITVSTTIHGKQYSRTFFAQRFDQVSHLNLLLL